MSHVQTTSTAARADRFRLVELDSLRGLAAVGVVIYHYGLHFEVHPADALFAPLYRSGFVLVDFFFILSGYVLARAYWNPARASRTGSNIMDRIARLYPLHFVTLLVVAGMQWVLVHRLGVPNFCAGQFSDPYHFVLNLLLLNASGLQQNYSFNTPSWSISTEFIVNVFFLAALSLPRRVAFGLFVAVLAFAIAMPFTGATWLLEPWIVRTCHGFFLGVLLQALLAGRTERTDGPGSGLADSAFAIAFVACSLFFAHNSAPGMGIIVRADVIHALLMTIIICAPMGRLTRAVLRQPALAFLGEISFSIYLVHFPVQLGLYILSRILHVSPFDSVWFEIFHLALILPLAAVTYRWIEMPGKRWMRSWGRPHKPAGGSVPEPARA